MSKEYSPQPRRYEDGPKPGNDYRTMPQAGSGSTSRRNSLITGNGDYSDILPSVDEWHFVADPELSASTVDMPQPTDEHSGESVVQVLSHNQSEHSLSSASSESTGALPLSNRDIRIKNAAYRKKTRAAANQAEPAVDIAQTFNDDDELQEQIEAAQSADIIGAISYEDGVPTFIDHRDKRRVTLQAQHRATESHEPASIAEVADGDLTSAWKITDNRVWSREELIGTPFENLTAPVELEAVAQNDADDATEVLAVTTTPEAVDPAVERAREYLNSLRSEMAAVAGKRQGRLFSFGDKKYKALEDDYNAQLAKLGRMECADLLNSNDKTASEKNVGVIGFIFDEQAKLRAATVENLQNTKVSAFIDFMNKGTKKQRFIKGVGLGFVGVVAGAGIGALAGVAAGAGLAAATAVTAKSVVSFGRYYAKKDNKQGRGMATFDDQEIADAAREKVTVALSEQSVDSDRVTAATEHFSTMFNQETHIEQAKRRKSARSALGGVALGLALGGAGAWAIGELAGGGHVGAWSNRNLPDNHADALDQPGGDTVTPDNNVTPPRDDLHDAGPQEPAPEIVPSEPAPMEYIDAAMTVSPGEGWYQTFSELGITNPTHQIELLNNEELMNRLASQGLAYRAPELGGWGMNMTTDGKMPQAALDLVAEYAVKNGYRLAA